jgi:hypothetical protein
VGGPARNWNATEAEMLAPYPCDAYLDGPVERLVRAIDVAAPAEVTYRWLCQLRVAPYSYDWLDNWGRRSPRELTPGADELEPGDDYVVVFRVVELEHGRHITGRGKRSPERLFGPMAVTYSVAPRGPDASRIVVCVNTRAKSLPARVRLEALAMGDLVMMRKQLRTIRTLAERDGAVRHNPPNE